MKIRASGPITPWQIDGEKLKTVTDLIFLGSKITVDGGHSHEIKDTGSWKESYDNLEGVLKSRDITFPTKVCIVRAMVFPIVMYGCESWTTMKAEYQKIDTFKLWCWRKLLSPLDSKEIKPVNPKGSQP